MNCNRWMIVLVIGLTVCAARAQDPAPATQPTTRGARGRGPVSTHPRDQLPFTNSSLTNINPALPTLFIAGDSTAATGSPVARGWGAVLVDYFDTTKVNLVNQAQGGARFNTYIPTRWPAIVEAIKPGDFVVIEFGHNNGPLPGIGDETQEVVNRRGGPPTVMQTHGWYLKKMISDVRGKGGIPIASTITLRNRWAEGKVERLKEQVVGQGGMSDWTRQVAANEKVLLVDHSHIIGDAYDKLGEEAVAKFFAPTDYLHTNTAGAIVNCETFIAGLKALPTLPLLDYLNEKGRSIPAHGASK